MVVFYSLWIHPCTVQFIGIGMSLTRVIRLKIFMTKFSGCTDAGTSEILDEIQSFILDKYLAYQLSEFAIVAFSCVALLSYIIMDKSK